MPDIYPVRFYVATKKNEIKSSIIKCIQVEVIILKCILESERQIRCFLSLVDLKFNISSLDNTHIRMRSTHILEGKFMFLDV